MDWKLIHVWEPAADDPQPQSLTDALLQARTSGTAGHAPYFIGVKLHDTDFTIQDDALIANNVFNSATKRTAHKTKTDYGNTFHSGYAQYISRSIA